MSVFRTQNLRISLFIWKQRFASTHHSCVSSLSLTRHILPFQHEDVQAALLHITRLCCYVRNKTCDYLRPKNHVHHQKLKWLHSKTNATHCPFNSKKHMCINIHLLCLVAIHDAFKKTANIL